MERKLQKIYLPYYNIFFERIHRINVNMDMMIKNVSLVELNITIVTVVLKTENFKD